ncbi:MAG: hypothetical protein U9R24_00110 [Thermodesulfobacteriota bacterium]|nr:hypothetical protein [Thermodesulfobacteriota bacterium]
MNTTDNRGQVSQISARVIADVIRSAGAKTLLFEVANNLIRSWEERGGVRTRLAPTVRRIISKVLRPGRNGSGGNISADAGRLLTAWAQKVNADHAGDPVCHAETRGETIHTFLANTDFGEIREMVENSEECALKTVEAFNENLWKYPAKVGSILGTLLAATNTGIRSTREILRPVEKNVSPDLLADIFLSLLKGLNAKEAANLVNSLCELTRRLHTGSYLLARGSKPLFQIYLTELLEEALPNIDAVLLGKAKIALAEDRGAIASALADALSDNPDLLLEMVSSYGAAKTPLITGASRKVRLFEEVDQGHLADAVSQGLSDLDTYEIAELINAAIRIVNTVHEKRPDVISSLMNSVVNSIDTAEIKTASEWIIPEIVEAFKPVTSEVAPSVIRGLCEILSPEDGFEGDEHEEAFKTLQAKLGVTGGVQ